AVLSEGSAQEMPAACTGAKIINCRKCSHALCVCVCVCVRVCVCVCVCVFTEMVIMLLLLSYKQNTAQYKHVGIQFNSIQFYLYSAITIQLSLGALQSPEPEPP